ncbi:MAG: 50S ribosomal protein L20 [Candidatus Vogelbacteria bacterium]|nr:50S ribosomal protein L20 [Candidatus Vogelbacteria bacterium]
MSRVKKGVNALKKRKNILKQVKGFRFGRSTKVRMAKDAIRHAGRSAFAHRRKKKKDFRRLFEVRINAAARLNGISYSKLIGALKKANIGLNRKVLSEMAMNSPASFTRVLTKVSK